MTNPDTRTVRQLLAALGCQSGDHDEDVRAALRFALTARDEILAGADRCDCGAPRARGCVDCVRGDLEAAALCDHPMESAAPERIRLLPMTYTDDGAVWDDHVRREPNGAHYTFAVEYVRGDLVEPATRPLSRAWWRNLGTDLLLLSSIMLITVGLARLFFEATRRGWIRV